MDLRHLPLVLLAFYGNRFPLVIATLIIAGSRFLFGVTPASVYCVHRHHCDQYRDDLDSSPTPESAVSSESRPQRLGAVDDYVRRSD